MKLVTANKLNRLWKNGITPALGKKIDKTKVLTTVEQIAANTNAENVSGAIAVKELINNLSNCKLVTEGSGADTKYYIQNGADTASKKSLCSGAKIKSSYIAKGTSNYTLAADAGYKFIVGFLSRYEAPSQHAFWSEDFSVNYNVSTSLNMLSISNDRKTLTASKLDTDYKFMVLGVEVPV